eukprot:m.1062294 g.1062294  ORF g.1062294 m.1062294 type:complete len:890 (-) comp24214_c0_seq1:1361-4030(-)
MPATDCPQSFKCPITQEVMRNPVCTCDGHTFERSAIEQWLIKKDTSPLTGLSLESRTLVPNVALRNAIEEFLGGCSTQNANQIEYSELDIERELAVGRAKSVHEGLWRGNRVAVIKVEKDTCNTESAVLARLSKHPSLIQFYGKSYDKATDKDVIVTELAPKGSLRNALESCEAERHSLCFGVQMAIAHQICEGMEAVAAEGLIHRNLGLRNILAFAVDPNDPALTDVKVSDFGLSKSGRTFYGGDEGMPTAWMSPESLQARSWSEKSDVWAFGVTLWELFSGGDIPFANLNDTEISEKILAGERLECPADCPQEVYKVMQICWQRRAEDRPSFRSLRIVLRDAERDVSVAHALANARSSSSSSGSKAKAAATPSGGDDGRSGGSASEKKGITSSARTGGSDRAVPERTTEEASRARIDATIRRMATAVDNPKIQEEGSRALANLAGTLFGRTHIAKAHGIEALVTAMKTHTHVQQVQECALAAMSNLSSSNSENQSKIAARGGIVVLIKAMQEHQSHPLVQQYGATALRNLTLHNAENKKAIALHHGIDALVTAMKNHPEVSSVQHYAADALQNIALHNAENKVTIQKVGGIHSLIAAMRKHPNEARVQQYACFALANLSANNADNAEIIAKEGAITEIIAAMTTHRGKPGVQRYGASALKYLAGENRENQEKIAKNEGIRALIAAMATHRTNDTVQQYAASALKNLAANNNENKSLITQVGGVGVLLTAMRSHRMKPLVQQHAASALQNLAGNHAPNKLKIASEGGIPLIIAAMINHPHETQVQRYAASALKNLSSDNSDNKLTITREGGIEALVESIRNHGAEAEVQQYAAGALQNIAANNAFTKAEVVRQGGVAVLQQSLETSLSVKQSKSVRESLQSALRVLDN